MSEPNSELVVRRCAELGIPLNRIEGLRNILKAAFYHVGLPGTPTWDVHIAWDHAVRLVTSRIACQGEYGLPLAMGRVLSQRAIDSRTEILANLTYTTPAARFSAWRSNVTLEHQEPVVMVENWIENMRPNTEQLLERLLTYPSVIVTKQEDLRLTAEGLRTKGSAAQRYAKAEITVVSGVVGSGEFFREGVPARRRFRKYREAPSLECTAS